MRALRFLFFAATVAAAWPAWSQQTVIVVRHAERLDSTPDPGLSAEGAARAEKLAALLANAGVQTIYSSQYQRCLQTTAPLAKRLGLTPVMVPAKDTDALIAKIRSHDKNETVLVVGHSNTVPAILKALGYTANLTIAEDEHNNLFVLTPREGTTPAVTRLTY